MAELIHKHRIGQEVMHRSQLTALNPARMIVVHLALKVDGDKVEHPFYVVQWMDNTNSLCEANVPESAIGPYVERH